MNEKTAKSKGCLENEMDNEAQYDFNLIYSLTSWN